MSTLVTLEVRFWQANDSGEWFGEIHQDGKMMAARLWHDKAFCAQAMAAALKELLQEA